MTHHYPIDDQIAVGLIPARGGSKSIPLKNLAPIADTPLVRFVIRAAHQASSLTRLYCSTDHAGIASLCHDEGIEVISRPHNLGMDDTPVTDVMLHFIETVAEESGRMPGMIALLQPTSPFILPKHIDECIAALTNNPGADSSQTVTPVFHNAHAYNQRIIVDGEVSFRFQEERRAAFNKQLKPKHYVFGNLVVTRTRSLLEGKDCFGNVSVPVEISRAYSIDVDTQEDLDYASYLLSKRLIDFDQ